jgi:2-methylcitrate dehydratase PrpD
MSITKELAQFALDLRLDKVPHEAVETAHVRILDTLGVALAGTPEACSRIATEVALESGATGDCTLIGANQTTSATHAALVNGVRAHALEFDDMTTSIVSHTSATVVPSVLALSEQLGVTGKQFLEAYIVGFEVTTRIGWSMGFNLLKHGWHPNGVLAVMGSAAAGARLLGANLDQTRAAIGIAASCSSGIRKNVGFMTKPLHMGHAAANGILAAQLASKGYTGDPDILERGPSSPTHKGHAFFSFPETYVGEGDYDLAQITRNMGTEYELSSDSTITRFHPGSSFPQAAIDEVIALVTTHDVKPEQIEKIRLGVSPLCLVIASYAAPRTAFDARFSLKFAISAAALDRTVTIRQYTDERVQRADAQEMMRRIEAYVPDAFSKLTDRWTGSNPTPVSCIVEIVLKNGQVLKGGRDTTRGYPGAKATWHDAMEKYQSCASLVMSEAQIARSSALVRQVEDLESIRELTHAFRI